MDGSGHATLPAILAFFWQLWWGVLNGKTFNRLIASSFSFTVSELSC